MLRAILTIASLLMMSAATAAQAPTRAAQPPSTSTVGSLTVTHVRGTVYMFTTPDGLNTIVQIGEYGPVVLDTPPAAYVPQLIQEIAKLTPQQLRYLMHTTASPIYMTGDVALLSSIGAAEAILHAKVYERMISMPVVRLLPDSVITYEHRQTDTFNSEPIMIYQARAATTDGDSVVHFRTSDVIGMGPLYTPGRYPVIDLQAGGTIGGLIEALYKTLEIAVSQNLGDLGGTIIIPGSGRMAEETDLAEYRNMVMIITERVRDLKRKGQTLEQVKANRPSADYDREYHASLADADRFVEAIYRTLSESPSAMNQNAEEGRSRP